MKLGRCKRSKEYIISNKGTRHENGDSHQRDHAPKRKIVDGCHLLELPVHLMYEILSRLPAESLFSCICVCKTLPKFHIDPYFAQLHLTYTPKDDGCLIVQDGFNASKIFFISMIDLERISPPWKNNSSVWDSCPWKTLTLPTHFSIPNVMMSQLVGSCNGLVCVNYLLKSGSMVCVCNPVLGEVMVLPQPWTNVYHCAFGYCSKSKLYKVVRFTYTSICEIHTLGTDYWSKLYNVPRPSTLNQIDSSFLNGNIPWITKTCNVSEIICSFNCETEQYLHISPPEHFFTVDTFKRMSSIEVGLLGGLFCISYLLDKAQFEVYVMKCYGVESSWTKEITVDMSLMCTLLTRGIHPNLSLRLNHRSLCWPKLLNNGDMLLSYLDITLVYYSPQKQAAVDIIGQCRDDKQLRDNKLRNYEVVEFVPSFVSLKNIGKPGSVKVFRRKKLQGFWPDKMI